MTVLRSQNNVLIGKIHFVTIGSLLWEPILRITFLKQLISSFKMATCCVKWLPAVFLDRFLALQAPKMAAPMEDLHWTVSYSAHWNALNGFLMCLNGIFYFA